MRQLHDLGFAVEEVSIAIDGNNKVLKFQPKLVAAGYHTNRLRELMGLETEELQAKRILASFDRYRAREINLSTNVNEVAFKWLTEIFNPIINSVPAEHLGRVEPAQLFHEVLEHRWYLSEAAGHDVGLDFACKAYISEVLPYRRDSGIELVQ